MQKIIIHDYCGHPFQFELSKILSKKYFVYHLYYVNDYGPKADFSNNIKNLKVIGVGKKIEYDKSRLFQRLFKDIEYGKEVSKFIKRIDPTLVVSGNCPTFAQEYIVKESIKKKIKFIFWVQDFYSIAVDLIFKKKIGFFSKFISSIFYFLEKKQLNKSNQIIIISKEFEKYLIKWKINKKKIHYIPNWGNISQINNESVKDKKYASKIKINSKIFTIIYTGTLALKHDQNLLIELSLANPNYQFIIFGVGKGFENLKKKENLPENLKLLGIQKFIYMNSVLSIADIFIATLSSDAGKFSVPSKILNYLCAGKPIIFCASKNNQTSKILKKFNCGKVFEDGNIGKISNFINEIKKNKKLRKQIGLNCRIYAEREFNLNKISNKFNKIFHLN